jgi:lysylphosphatidylglycerol synthase-like protein
MKILNSNINNRILKVIIFSVLIGLLYYQVIYKAEMSFNEWAEGLEDINFIWIGVVCLLMLMNWGLEAFKWKYLLSPVKSVSYPTALQSVFCGISFSIFTPNRIGEYAGRILFLPFGYRIKGVLIAIVSSISQLIITLCIGVFGFGFLIAESFHWNSNGSYLIIILAIVVSVILIWVYFHLQVFQKLISRWVKFKFVRKTIKALHVLSSFPEKQLFFVLGISLVRYIVYSVQFLLLLIIFDVNLTFLESAMGIVSVFLIQTLVPLPAIAELGWRGNVSVEIFGLFSQNQYGIVAATTFLWFINLIIPALAGSVFLFNSRILKQKK